MCKFNLNLLNDPSFKIYNKNEIHSYLETNDNEEVTTPILWDAAKAVLRGQISTSLTQKENSTTGGKKITASIKFIRKRT